jgi:hypothetical protein
MSVMRAEIDWRLKRGIASLVNFGILLVVLLTFPLVLRWTEAPVADIEPQSPQHTRAFLRFFRSHFFSVDLFCH